jgi:hypothetical protein
LLLLEADLPPSLLVTSALCLPLAAGSLTVCKLKKKKRKVYKENYTNKYHQWSLLGVMKWNQVEVQGHFGRTHCLHSQGQRLIQAAIEPYNITSQKTALFIVTAVRTSTATSINHVCRTHIHKQDIPHRLWVDCLVRWDACPQHCRAPVKSAQSTHLSVHMKQWHAGCIFMIQENIMENCQSNFNLNQILLQPLCMKT